MQSLEIPEFRVGFVEEIDFHELRFGEVVGRGAFGVVSRAIWRDKDVAVKLIETESEKRAFITELKQLSRVDHPNIVKLYGASTKLPVCLVMEYAEGGSLYNALHGNCPLPVYYLCHALSWCLQCAKGVEYLHNMRPKPLIHRDLKPPNLLLVCGGTILKICDFGTACDVHTHMTNNKGSAAWMAPEVFEGSNYSEKCDVFSWGIILWEVLTRRKPFEEIGGSAFRIMWAVHNGTRPPLIKDCPKPLESMMTRCWSSNPVERPPMSEIVTIMSILSQHCPGAEARLVLPQEDDTHQSSVYDTPPMTGHTTTAGGTGGGHTLIHPGEEVPLYQQATPKPVIVEENKRTSAPASLAASRESLLDKGSSRSSTPSVDLANKRYSADLTKIDHNELMSQGKMPAGTAPKPVRSHRRTGSHGTAFPYSNHSSLVPPPPHQPAHPVRTHRRTGSYGSSGIVTGSLGGGEMSGTGSPPVPHMTPPQPPPMHHAHTEPTNLCGTAKGTTTVSAATKRSVSCNPAVTGATAGTTGATTGGTTGSGARTLSGNMLDPAITMAVTASAQQTQALPPCLSCPESVALYEETQELIQQHLRVQIEIAVVNQQKEMLEKKLKEEEEEDQNSSRFVEELVSENDSLLTFHKNLEQQLEELKRTMPHRFAS